MSDKKIAKNRAKMNKYTTKEKVLISALVSFVFSFIIFLFNPIDIVANNAQEFSFALSDIIGGVLLSFFASFAILFAVLMIFNKYILNIITSLLLSVFISDYIYNLTVGKGTLVSGDVRIDYGKSTTIFLIIIIAVAYALFLAGVLLKNKWKNVCAFICVLLIAMNSATLVSDFATKDFVNKNGTTIKYALSEKNLFGVSKKENVVYFLFDRFDTKFYDEVVNDNPNYFSKSLDGFTYFDNAVSTFSRTYPAVAGLITGVTYDGNTSSNEYFKKAYTTSPFLKDLKSNGYEINIYADRYYEYSDAECFKDTVSNATKINGYTPDKTNILKYLLSLSDARTIACKMPTLLFKHTANGTVLTLSKLNSKDKIYHDDDAALYKNLKSSGLHYTNSDKNYTFIYLHGTHSPYTLDADAQRVKASTSKEQTIGSFKIIADYVDQMKKLGVYDNSTIVITGDHGYPYTDTEPLLESTDTGTKTAVFVKPKSSKTSGLSVSHAPASVADIIPTIVKDTGIKTSTDYGESLFDIAQDSARKRIYYHSRLTGNSKLILDKYTITGDAANIKNWKLEESRDTNQAWY